MLHWLIIFTHLVAFHASAATPEWIQHARQLIGENQTTREQAIAALKQNFSTIDSLLPELEGPNRNYALDVAVALKLPYSVQRLLPGIESDRDGAVTLAVNALMDDQTHRTIAEYYMRYLEKRSVTDMPVPVLMAMVDYLTHLRVRFGRDVFLMLLAHSRLEVQQAAALHFAIVDDKALTKLFKKNMKQLYPQVRAQAVLTLFDMKDMAQVKKICGGDEDPIVKSACQGLPERPPSDGSKEKRGKRKRKK